MDKENYVNLRSSLGNSVGNKPANQLLGAVVDVVLACGREDGFDSLHVNVSLASASRCGPDESSDDQALDESSFDQQQA